MAERGAFLAVSSLQLVVVCRPISIEHCAGIVELGRHHRGGAAAALS
ncbi:hypothetical protein [Bradyrhizobium sp.]|nr:hypothetical protein [Bradyrhizobium sp.]MDP3694278.1 hypothetical protein [Bradyrhizobium sp.]